MEEPEEGYELRRAPGICCPEPSCDYVGFEFDCCKGCGKVCKGCTHNKKMKYKVELRCKKCNTVINETIGLNNYDLAMELKQNALINPLLGWCEVCDAKPIPHIIELKS